MALTGTVTLPSGKDAVRLPAHGQYKITGVKVLENRSARNISVSENEIEEDFTQTETDVEQPTYFNLGLTLKPAGVVVYNAPTDIYVKTTGSDTLIYAETTSNGLA